MSSKIEWTDQTWNPVHGCTKTSPGCAHCYAETMARRQQAMGTKGYEDGFKVTLAPHKLGEPLKWRKPRKVFVVSMGDLFHKDVPFEYIAAVFGVMAACPQHTFQVLTKRPERMLAFFSWINYAPSGEKPQPRLACLWYAERQFGVDPGDKSRRAAFDGWPLPNVWLGVTTEDQQRADERIPCLLQCPAVVRFVSVEPMLGPVDLSVIPATEDDKEQTGRSYARRSALNGEVADPGHEHEFGLPSLDWVICGGESGPGARPMAAEWAQDLRNQCGSSGVPFLFKQWGEWLPSGQLGARGVEITIARAGFSQKVGKHRAGRLLDSVTHDGYPEVPRV